MLRTVRRGRGEQVHVKSFVVLYCFLMVFMVGSMKFGAWKLVRGACGIIFRASGVIFGVLGLGVGALGVVCGASGLSLGAAGLNLGVSGLIFGALGAICGASWAHFRGVVCDFVVLGARFLRFDAENANLSKS